MRLAGKTAIITGGASNLGAATVRRFVQEGAKVCIADLLRDEAEAMVKELGPNTFFMPLDHTDEAQWVALVAEVTKRCGRIDILVNNAGMGPGTMDVFDTAVWDRLMAVNARGPFLGVKTVVPHMVEKGGGAIVNLSSVSANVGFNLHMGYGSSKGAVLTLTKTAAIQFARKGVRVNSVHPGVMTPMRNSTSKADPVGRQKMLDGIPMGRIGAPADIANAVLFLASDEAAYITGAELHVDGGYLAQ